MALIEERSPQPDLRSPRAEETASPKKNGPGQKKAGKALPDGAAAPPKELPLKTRRRKKRLPEAAELLRENRLLKVRIKKHCQMEENLRESQEKLLKIVESIRDGFFTLDKDWRFSFVNNEALMLWGKKPEQLLGNRIWEVIPQTVGTIFEEKYRKAIDEQVPVIFEAVSPLLGIWMEVRVYPTREGLSVYFHDITRRKNAEDELNRYRNKLEELVSERTRELGNANEKLQQEVIERTVAEMQQSATLRELENVNRELNDFAYVVSHDLKAPLRAISSLVDWIAGDYDDKFDEQGRLQLKLLLNRVQRMHKFIDGILEYSKIGRITKKTGLVDLNELVEEVVETLSVPPHIRVTMEERLPSIICERTRLVQIFQNLLDNAIKSIYRPKGEIRIGYNMDEDFYLFHVADNGTGIEEKYFGKIFQIFQTLKARDEVESTGIGLAVVKKIVEVYGGRIWVDSKIGEGSTFYFTLPKDLKR